MKRDILKKLVISIGILLAGIVAGYLLLTVVYCIDVPESRYEETKQILAEEGYHPRELLRTGKADYYQENYPDILDFGTDELIYRYSLENISESCFQRALVKDYGRYWHGYVVLLRPLSLFFSLDEIRYINLGTQCFLVLALICLIYIKTQKIRYALIAFGMYYILGPGSLACNMQYSSIFYVSILSGIATIELKKTIDKNNRYIYLFLITGMATSYIDFLTYPLLAWCIPATILIAFYNDFAEKEDESKKWVGKIGQLIISALSWSAGYILMWAGKWTLGVLLSEKRVWRQAAREAKFIVGTTDNDLVSRFESFFINWRHLTYKPFVIIFAGIFIWWIIMLVKKGIVKDYRIPAFVMMLFSSLAWYIVAFTHTRGHHIFTWRVALSTVLAFFMIIALTTDYKNESHKMMSMSYMARVAGLALCIMLGTLVYCIVPAENQTNWNYDRAEVEAVLPPREKNAYVMEFIPMHSHVYTVSPLLYTSDSNGYAELILSDGDTIIDTEEIFFDDAEDTNVRNIFVNWHLKKGRHYRITISTEHLDSPITTWLAEATDRFEFSGGETLGIGYSYYTHFTSRKDSLFYIISWSVFWMVLFYLGVYLVSIKKE